jgi:ATP-binding cassette subfamily F protein 3
MMQADLMMPAVFILDNDDSRSKRKLVEVKNLCLAYGDKILYDNISIDLRENEALELRGRNGSGKTSLIKVLTQAENAPDILAGTVEVDKQVRIGIYEQEISHKYLDLSLEEAIERLYLDKNLSISTTKIRNLLSDYLFSDGDRQIPLIKLSGGQKARFQIISMLANEPQLLFLDEPTNHLDLPSIEELENALARYSGAVIYVSHDGYFRDSLGGEVLTVGS